MSNSTPEVPRYSLDFIISSALRKERRRRAQINNPLEAQRCLDDSLSLLSKLATTPKNFNGNSKQALQHKKRAIDHIRKLRDLMK
jgi:hypothetical protein